jgi:hypothetical protein
MGVLAFRVERYGRRRAGGSGTAAGDLANGSHVVVRRARGPHSARAGAPGRIPPGARRLLVLAPDNHHDAALLLV